jgi:RimJ/RimL family protein N-acetyltransferase
VPRFRRSQPPTSADAASLAVAARPDFTEEGTLRRCIVLLGRRYDVILFSRLVTDAPP